MRGCCTLVVSFTACIQGTLSRSICNCPLGCCWPPSIRFDSSLEASPSQFIGRGQLQLYRVIATLGLGPQEGTSAFRHSIATGATSQLAYLLDPGAICHNSKSAWGPHKPGYQPPPPPHPGVSICDDESRLRPMRRLVGALPCRWLYPFV